MVIGDLDVDLERHAFHVDSTTVSEGDWITLDGATGRVFLGDLPTIPSEIVRVTSGALPANRAPMYQAFAEVLGWADEARRLRVRANADTPRDARVARQFGAEGIGVIRADVLHPHQAAECGDGRAAAGG